MDIPNLATPSPAFTPKTKIFSLPVLIITITIALAGGFWLSRFFPMNSQTAINLGNQSVDSAISTDNISQASDLKPGIVYGNKDPACKDTATGLLEKGNINGEGTHILNRPGGKDQRASLTSSVVDLDLFVDKNITITGQTNASKKTGWLLDICSVQISQ